VRVSRFVPLQRQDRISLTVATSAGLLCASRQRWRCKFCRLFCGVCHRAAGDQRCQLLPLRSASGGCADSLDQFRNAVRTTRRSPPRDDGANADIQADRNRVARIAGVRPRMPRQRQRHCIGPARTVWQIRFCKRSRAIATGSGFAKRAAIRLPFW